ncbi:MAG: hypothetical protein EZS28_004811 [Streblomastix strix]|uniref:Uncharacterized protein n=1 Tax=Streblomastix strix TaxID=222440 RepID=A0A5J4WXT0_9EUKA|nr:MAG: hypothetical protein EZS28_004811 [Streblomastix strix]
MVAQENEKILVKSFKEKLDEANQEIEELKKREPEFGADHWMAKYKGAMKELEAMRTEAIRLDRLNDLMEKELQSLRVELGSSRSECEGLNKKLSGAQREIKYLNEIAIGKTTRSVQLGQEPAIGTQISATGGYEPSSTSSALTVEQRTKATEIGKNVRKNLSNDTNQTTKRLAGQETIDTTQMTDADAALALKLQRHNARLRQLLDGEKRNVRTIRNAHLQTLAEKTELQTHLSECINDTKKEMEDSGGYMVFNPEWRRRTMELLLSRPRVLELLNDKNYPTVTKLPSGIMNLSNKTEAELFRAVYDKEREAVEAEQRLHGTSILQAPSSGESI